MKHLIALIAVTLAACGGGSVYEDEAPAPVVVQPPINYCTDGVGVGPCVPLPEPACTKDGEVVVGPAPACKVE